MLPKVNQVLTIQVQSVDPEESRQEYKSRIADIGSAYISIEIPMHAGTGQFKRLYPGDQLHVSFVTEEGVRHDFPSGVLGFKEEDIRLVLIRIPDPEQITKVQRRNYLRVNATLEIAVKVSDQIPFTALTEDIGGGGVSFRCDSRFSLREGDVLSCWLLVPFRNGAIEHANFKGKIVRLKALENGKQVVMVQFTEIADAERQKIIRCCFERQLDYRKQ